MSLTVPRGRRGRNGAQLWVRTAAHRASGRDNDKDPPWRWSRLSLPGQESNLLR